MAQFGKKNISEMPAEQLALTNRSLTETEAPGDIPVVTKVMTSEAKDFIRDQIFTRIEPLVAVRISKRELMTFVNKLVAEIANERKILLNQDEQRLLGASIVDEMVGLGPIEPLLNDTSVADILVNGPRMIYVERHGKLQLTKAQFRSDAHVLHVAQRIASSIGRRIDESSPMLDARLADGSRVNVIIPPLSLKGPCMSIRKFSKSMMDFSSFITSGTLSPQLGRALDIVRSLPLEYHYLRRYRHRQNYAFEYSFPHILIRRSHRHHRGCGRTQLQQAHVVRMETRPPILKVGRGQRATWCGTPSYAARPHHCGRMPRMEAFDMLQAMNTGHDGTMTTIHANSARDALGRIENMILMGTGNLPMRAIRTQITSALDLVVHSERMRDGVRRVTEVMEVVGLEGEVITLGSLFMYKFEGENPDGGVTKEPSSRHRSGRIFFHD